MSSYARRTFTMPERLPVRDALVSFAAREPLRAALFLTYSFDGRWFEDALVPDLCERSIATMLVMRDRNAITSEAPSVRYRKANACASAVFHPKLALLITESRARAVISSANLTRGGFERQRELGRVFDLGPSESGAHRLFTSLVEYLENGVSREVRGDSARDLVEVTRALREVVRKYKAPTAAESHLLLHNYTESIWAQLLTRVPHRVLRRAVIVSPFFEPDRKHPEDPALGPQDASIFARMLFEDFEFDAPKDEIPVRVFLRQSEGRTELPVRKLAKLAGTVAFFAQDEREQRLHAKLLLLEGAAGPGREPFLLALHGSPNFTTAGLIHCPPNGNSELAVLTTLPAKRKSLNRSVAMLGLERGFTHLDDVSSLQAEKEGEAPMPPSQGVADATYRVAERVVNVSLVQAAPAGARVRILLQRDGAWVVIGEADASATTEVVVAVTGLAELDGKTNLLELRGTTVRIEVVGADGGVLTSDTAPVNVDVPEEFCGLTLVGSALLTLDERVARAGVGLPPTYREQQKWLEARKALDPASRGAASVAHQADLDRFYRNVHQGLRGILARTKATPGSEFVARRSMDELCRWAVEAATSDAVALTRECRLFLVERLLRGARSVVDGCSPPLKARMPAIAADLHLSDRLGKVVQWLESIDEPVLATYAAGSRAHARQILGAFKNGAAG
jgi:hypothetical protein